MKNPRNLLQWGTSHHPDWLVVFRVLLGILLLTKGVDFIFNMVQLQDMLSVQKNETLQLSFLPYVIAGIHIFGGMFIVAGLFTRILCLLQLPIILTALILFITNDIYLSGPAVIELSVVLLFLLFFLMEGSGAISLDRYFRFNRNTDINYGI